MSETAKGAGSGAVQGAGAGASVGAIFGGAGAVPGAIIGAVVGGVWGAFGGSFGDKAKKKAKQARQIQQLREMESYRQQYLLQLRQARSTRATTLSTAVAMGVEEGSGSQAALSSIGSQTANNIEYMSVDRSREIQIAELTSKANKLSKKSGDVMGALSVTSTLVGFAGAVASAAGALSAAQAAGNSAANAGTNVAASGAGSGIASETASTIAGNAGTGGLGAFSPVNSGAFSSSVWKATSAQLLSQAKMGVLMTTSGVQIGRSLYSGTRLQ